MNTKIVLTLSILLGSIIAQAEMNYSYEMKYGVGKQVERTASDNPVTSDYSYFENLLDINTYFGDHVYLYTQLEYSNPPLFGYSRTGIDSMLSAFYIEYSHDNLNIKIGDLYELYGRGLNFYTMQDQNVDYDNSIKGLNIKYLLMNNFEFSALIGQGEYGYRSNPAKLTNDRYFNNDVILGSLQYENEIMGSFQYLISKKRSFFDIELIKSIFESDSELGEEFLDRPDYLDLYLNFLNGTASADTLLLQSHNINWNIFLGILDIYIDKVWINYDKIYGDEVFGSRFYTSIYTEILETGITYEYKNYHTPYLIKSISNPPIGYRESSSILASRNAHSINFGNEVGHQIDFNKNINGALNILGNLSISHRHQKKEMEELTLIDFLTLEEDSSIYDYYPFRQVYMEINEWKLSDRLFYKVGLDHFTEYLNGKNIFVLTIPTQWVWKLANGSSFTIYFETQEKIVNKLSSIDPPDVDEYISHYLSVSYSHMGRWIVTGFYDYENYTKKMMRDSDYVLFNELTTVSSSENQWPGLDFSFFFTSATQISFFYGSQKGGLVCANGICAEQPGFEDGFKVTFRSLF